MEIRDDRIYGASHGEYFNVLMHNGDNPAVKVTADFDGMPLNTLLKLAFDTMKVKFRPYVKGLKTDKLKETFNNKVISWREMISKEAVRSTLALADKTPEELDAEIQRIMELRKSAVATTDE